MVFGKLTSRTEFKIRLANLVPAVLAYQVTCRRMNKYLDFYL